MKQWIDAFIKQRTNEMKGSINAMMDMRLEAVHEEPKELVLSFCVEAWQLNPMHTMHGGMIATIVDMSMGCLSYACNGGHPNPTIEMQLRYLKGIEAGPRVYVKVCPLHIGKRMIQTQAELYQKEELVAVASGSYMINRECL